MRRPTALELRLDFVELARDEIRIMAGDLTEIVRRSHVVVRAIGRSLRQGVVMRAKMCFVFTRERAGSFRNRSTRPPSAECAGDSANQRADWSGCRSDSRTDQHARDPARRLGEFVGDA